MGAGTGGTTDGQGVLEDDYQFGYGDGLYICAYTENH